MRKPFRTLKLLPDGISQRLPSATFIKKATELQDDINKHCLNEKVEAYNNQLKEFYESVTVQDWIFVIIGLAYKEMSKDAALQKLAFDEYAEEFSYKIPILPGGREPYMEVAYLIRDTFSELSIKTKRIIYKAANIVFEEAVDEENNILVECMLKWNAHELPCILKPDSIEKVLAVKGFNKFLKWFAFMALGNTKVFHRTVTIKKLKELQVAAKLPLSAYLGLRASQDINELAGGHFSREFADIFKDAKDADFDFKYLGNIAALRRWIQIVIRENGMNVGYNIASSGIGLVSEVYKTCCPKAKGIIESAIKELEESLVLVDSKLQTPIRLGFMRTFSDTEIALLDVLRKK